MFILVNVRFINVGGVWFFGLPWWLFEGRLQHLVTIVQGFGSVRVDNFLVLLLKKFLFVD